MRRQGGATAPKGKGGGTASGAPVRGATGQWHVVKGLVAAAEKEIDDGGPVGIVLDELFSALRVIHAKRMASRRKEEKKARAMRERRRGIARLRETVKRDPVQEGDELAAQKIEARFAEVDSVVSEVLETRMTRVLALLVGRPVPNDSAKELARGETMTEEYILRMTPRELRLIGLDRDTYDKLDLIFQNAEIAIQSAKEEAFRDTAELRRSAKRIEAADALRRALLPQLGAARQPGRGEAE